MTPTDRRDVLIVDDDPDIRDAVGECLRYEGYDVHSATDGRDALDRLEYGLRPAVILLDLMMPVLNGFDVLEALKSRPEWKSIPVVIVSANRGYEAEDLSGAVSILRKPVNVDRLLAAVEQAVAS
ncbi:MAG TPA: response regulator [Thermoplasmata archaeon]|nr:response regulator [Thermoplasmata archaeon]